MLNVNFPSKSGFIIVFIVLFTVRSVWSLGPIRPKEPSKPVPAPPKAPVKEPPVVSDPVDYREASLVSVGRKVDSYNGSTNLIRARLSNGSRYDGCSKETESESRFAGVIYNYVDQVKDVYHAPLSNYVQDVYNLMSMSRRAPVGLYSHSMCTVTKSTLTKTLRSSSRVPSQSVVNLANEFVTKYNSARSSALKGNTSGKKAVKELMTKFMGCLAYTESLSTADTSSSNRVAAKYAPNNYRKPAGVKFYEDPYQPAASKLNIGLFQFTPNARGNIESCVRRWSAVNPSCAISTGSSTSTMIRAVGSAKQNFNAFCGVQKIMDTFYVQVNSEASKRSHPYNLKSNGSLKAPADRCVSFHFLAGQAYNHFGPLQNSTGRNMEKLLKCALSK